MKQSFTLFKCCLFVLFIFITNSSYSQTLLLQESFEGDATYYDANIFSDGESDYFLVYSNGENPPTGWPGDLLNVDGTKYFAAEDTDEGLEPGENPLGDGPGINAYCILNSQNVSSYSQVRVVIAVAAAPSSNVEHDESPIEGLEVQYAFDSNIPPTGDLNVAQGNFTMIGAFRGEELTSSYYREDSNLDGVGDGTLITSSFQDFIYTFNTNGATNVSVRIMINTDGSEEIAFDNIRIYGVGSNNTVPTASSFLATPIQYRAYTFASVNFGYSDRDGDPIDHVRVTAIPGTGSLWVDSDASGTVNGAESALLNGGTISKAYLDAGYLKYLNTSGASSSFTFDVNDGTAYSAARYTASLSVADNTAPLLVSNSPLDNAKNVYLSENIILNFDDNMQAGTGNITIKKVSDNTVFEQIAIGDAKIDIVSDQVRIDPASTLARGIAYYIEIDASALEDDAGNSFAGISDNSTFNFTAVDVVINEVVTDPQQDWSTNGFNGTINAGAISSGTDEWIELLINSDGIDLTGWTIELLDGSDITGDLSNMGAFDVLNYIGSGSFTSTIAGAYLVLGDVYDNDGDEMSNEGLTINLKDPGGAIVDVVVISGEAGQAPSGHATDIYDESVQRYTNGLDTDIHSNDFTLGMASMGAANTGPSVTLSVSSATIVEASGVSTLTATLSAAASQNVTVALAVDGSSTAVPADYALSSSSIVIIAGSTTGTATITAIQDLKDENHETLIVNITGVTNGTESGTQQETVTISDDDATPTVTLSQSDATISEAAGTNTITATLSAVSGRDVTVTIANVGAATDSGTDYSLSSSTITIDEGSITGTATITAVQDVLDEYNESIFIDITAVTNGFEDGTQQVTSNITDDDATPTVSLSQSDVTITEAAGTNTITATLSAVSGRDVRVTIAVNGASEAAIGDYDLSSSTITIYESSTSETATITAVQDDFDENNESIIVDITAVTNGFEDGAQQVTSCITDDDDSPTITTNNTLTLNEAATATISSDSHLSATDADDDDATLVFTMTTNTGNGALKKSGSTLNQDGTFTQDDLTEGRMTYVHDGTNTDSDSFVFKVSDDNGNELTNQTFSIDVRTYTQMASLTLPATASTDNSDLNVDFTLPEAASPGTVKMAFTRTGGTADGNAPHVLTFATGFESADRHITALDGTNLSSNANVESINTDGNDALVDGAIYSVRLKYQDVLLNAVASIISSNFTYDNISQLPTLASPATSSSDNASLAIDFTLPELASPGTVKMTFTRTGGIADANAPHVITFVSGFETAAQHITTLDGADLSTDINVASVNTDGTDALVNGAIYSVKLAYQDAVGNPQSSQTNTVFTYDLTTQLATLNLPTTSGRDNVSLAIDFSLPEAASPGTVKMTFTRTGGTADGNAPHILTFKSGFETAAQHTTILNGADFSTNSNVLSVSSDGNDFLMNGAIYYVMVAYQDALGNPQSSTTNTGFTYDLNYAPSLTTQAVSSISKTTATGNGTITDLGFPNPTEHGVCWNTGGSPTIADSKTTEGSASATVAFTSGITGLTPGTTYYVRAYASNTTDTSYGEEVNFTAHEVPSVTTQAVSSISTTTVTANGNITDLGVPNPTQHGFCWNTGGSPTIVNDHTLKGTVSSTGAFTSNISGLINGTTYHLRAYVISASGTVYGVSVAFTTLDITAPSGSSDASSSISTTGATLNATVNDNNAVTTINFEYGLDTNYGSLVAASQSPLASGSGSTSVSATLSSLTQNTRYYYRVVAQNSQGTTYGAGGAFNTLTIPVITASQSFIINENIANTAAVGTALATDADAGTSFSSWTEIGGDGVSIFEINASTGAITVTDNLSIDYETKTSYTYTVTVSDGTNTSAVETITINITDVNDVNPVVTASQTFNIDEDELNSASIGTVLASDGDVTTTTFSNWAITAGNTNSVFAINTSTGELIVNDTNELDYESIAGYNLSVSVSDGTNTSAVETITINITDVNDVNPVVTASQTFNIDEDELNSASIGTVLASDGDVTTTTFSNWAITAGNTNSVFAINTSTGELIVNDTNELDYESITSYNLSVTVFDGINTAMTETVVVVVNDTNEVPIALQLSNVTIAENLAVGTQVGILSASDVDANQTYTYTIAENENFEILGDKLISKAAFDYEAHNLYSVEITVTDQGGLNHKQSFTIQIINVNEAPTALHLSNTTLAENAIVGTEVGSLTASDVDASEHFTYTISGNDNFKLSGNKLVSKVAFDFETQNSYSVEITVTDQGGLSFKQSFTIHIDDVNEAPTAIQLSANTIAENAIVGTEVGSLTVSDVDADKIFIYTIVENENFEILGDMLVSKAAFDYEAQNLYSVEITVTDQGGLTHKQNFTIQVSDVNEAPTALHLSNTAFAENAVVGTEVGTLTATDENADEHFTYAMLENDNFEIVGNKLVSKVEFDYETKESYTFEITVTDQGNLSFTQSFTIHIEDVNEAPLFTSEPIIVGVEAVEYSYTIECMDVDKDVISLVAIEKPECLSLLDNGNGTWTLSGTPTIGGLYHVLLEASDSEFTVQQKFDIEVEVVTGIELDLTASTVNIYPNPVADELHIDLSELKGQEISIALYNLTGSLIFKEAHQNIGKKVRMSKSLQYLRSGMYLLVLDTDGIRKTYKIVKK